MNKPNLSIVLATLLATSGFAMAQNTTTSTPPFKTDGSATVTTPAPAGEAKTRAEVKGAINAPNSVPGSPTQDARARSEAPVPVTTGNASGTTRADVKAGVKTPNAQAGAPTQDARARSEADVGAGGTSQNSRADVKAEAAASKTTSTAQERKARSAERKAARNADSPLPTAKEAGGASSKINAN